MPRVEGIQVMPGVFAPLLIVSIEFSSVVLEGPALIDSGADCTVIPGEILEATAHTFDSLPPHPGTSVGAGGKFETRICQGGTVKWRKWTICDEFQVAAPGTLPWALLGRQDFFRLFVVRFQWHRNPPFTDIDPVTP